MVKNLVEWFLNKIKYGLIFKRNLKFKKEMAIFCLSFMDIFLKNNKQNTQWFNKRRSLDTIQKVGEIVFKDASCVVAWSRIFLMICFLLFLSNKVGVA